MKMVGMNFAARGGLRCLHDKREDRRGGAFPGLIRRGGRDRGHSAPWFRRTCTATDTGATAVPWPRDRSKFARYPDPSEFYGRPAWKSGPDAPELWSDARPARA